MAFLHDLIVYNTTAELSDLPSNRLVNNMFYVVSNAVNSMPGWYQYQADSTTTINIPNILPVNNGSGRFILFTSSTFSGLSGGLTLPIVSDGSSFNNINAYFGNFEVDGDNYNGLYFLHNINTSDLTYFTGNQLRFNTNEYILQLGKCDGYFDTHKGIYIEENNNKFSAIYSNNIKLADNITPFETEINHTITILRPSLNLELFFNPEYFVVNKTSDNSFVIIRHPDTSAPYFISGVSDEVFMVSKPPTKVGITKEMIYVEHPSSRLEVSYDGIKINNQFVLKQRQPDIADLASGASLSDVINKVNSILGMLRVHGMIG